MLDSEDTPCKLLGIALKLWGLENSKSTDRLIVYRPTLQHGIISTLIEKYKQYLPALEPALEPLKYYDCIDTCIEMMKMSGILEYLSTSRGSWLYPTIRNDTKEYIAKEMDRIFADNPEAREKFIELSNELGDELRKARDSKVPNFS